MLRFRVLGPLEVERSGQPVEIVGRRQRTLLSLLLLSANRPVDAYVLIERLWGESPPPTALKALHNSVSQLRKVLGDGAIETHESGGYLLRVEPGGLDADEFEELYDHRDFARALALWRGPAYPELRDQIDTQGDLRRLEELRLAAIEESLDERLTAGDDTLVGELQGLVARHPHRERLQRELMLALYRTGRQAEALDAYHTARRTLIDELGIEPSPELQDLHRSILRQERTLTVSADRDADRLDEVTRALLSGRLIPVLGPSLPRPNSDSALADRLSLLFDCPPEQRGSLARVSEYVSLTEGIGPLYDELHALLDHDAEPGPIERFLAGLPPVLRELNLPQLVVVTTSYDDGLESALREAQEDVDVVTYVAQGPHRGKFVHTSVDGTRVVDDPNADTSVRTGHVPVVLKIHGCVDRRPAREWESFVVSEDDYIDYLANGDASTAFPVTLAARLRHSHFLFLAYGVVDWNLRVFLRRMWGDARVDYRSWAVQPEPGALERDFWRHRNVDVVNVGVEEYVAALEKRIHVTVGTTA